MAVGISMITGNPVISGLIAAVTVKGKTLPGIRMLPDIFQKRHDLKG